MNIEVAAYDMTYLHYNTNNAFMFIWSLRDMTKWHKKWILQQDKSKLHSLKRR